MEEQQNARIKLQEEHTVNMRDTNKHMVGLKMTACVNGIVRQ